MKRIFLSLIGAVCSIYAVHAAIATVSNNASSPGQYTNLQTAINSSNPGDTLYVQGSPTTYGDITINKKLTLIGAGYAPDSTDFNISTQIGQVLFDTVFPTIISGSKFIGLSFSNTYYAIQIASGDRGFINNITFEKCYFHNYYNYQYFISGNNWMFLNCIFDNGYVDINNYSNIIFSNCFMISAYIYNSNKNSVNFYNTIFMDYTGSYFNTVSNTAVYNSIFWNNAVNGCSNCLFMNNITYDDVARDLPGAGNSGTGNINNTDPQFVSILPSPNTSIPYADLKLYNWSLKVASPGHNNGTDGTDIGFYGGAYPYKNLSGMYHQIPLIKTFIIKNPVAQKNGTLKSSVTATKK